MSMLTYGIRVNKIFKAPNKTAFFTPSEIVTAIVNLEDAKNSLIGKEYLFVLAVFEIYKRMKKKLLLSKRGFLGVCNEIISNFDLIAPYYKFCGDARMRIMMFEEDEKYEYRQRAKEILAQKSIFKEEWQKLHKEFFNKFYS